MNFLRLFLCAYVVLMFSADILAAQSETVPEWRYSVRPGDNLIQFAKRYLVNPDDWPVLQRLNHIKAPTRMMSGSVLRVPLNLVKQGAAAAQVVLASGQASIVQADNRLLTVTKGQQLTAGMVLATGENSKLDIQFADGSVMSMGSNTRLTLDTLSIYSGGGMVDTTVRLQQGRTEVQANPQHVLGNKMRIITPSAVAAVRGTTFRVSADGVIMRQETLEGKVALIASEQEVAVDKGFGSLSEAGNAPLPPVLLLPAPTTDALAIKLEALPVRFAMAEQAGAVAWLGSLASDEKHNNIVAQHVSQGRDLVFADLRDGDYYLVVRAQDKNGIEGYDSMHKFTLNAQPFAPLATAPKAGQTIREAHPLLSWSKNEVADQYLLELSDGIDFKEILHAEKLAENQYKISKDLTPGQYFWRVASIAGDDQGPYMGASSFTYKAKPPMPNISQLTTSIAQNKVSVNASSPPTGLRYVVTLENPANRQTQVWQGDNLDGNFNFMLREFGKQTLHLQLVDAEGMTGPVASYEFDAPAP